jgi:deferrochelatase/peroxidase EfeB
MLNTIYTTLINNRDPIDPFNENAPNYEQYKSIFMDLQGGVLKSYGRDFSIYIFVQFDKNKIDKVKQWIGSQIANSVTSTWKQLCHTKDYKKEISRRRQENLDCSTYHGELCANFFLSYHGYIALGLDPTKLNPTNPNIDTKVDDPLFKKGMRHDWEESYRLEHPPDAYWYSPPEHWDINRREKRDQSASQENSQSSDIHALVVLAHDSLERLQESANAIMSKFEADTFSNERETLGKVMACEAGHVLRESNQCQSDKPPTGPFGFADGISQPLFLKSDYDKYWQNQDIKQWDPKASLDLVLLKDPFGEDYSYGSYCVFQKLETNYQRFEREVEKLACKLGCEPERASALVIGRFKDGTPIADHQTSGNSISNSFNYVGDNTGGKCPLQAHIRKANPRKDRDDAKLEASRKKNRIFRAGVTYFDDSKLPKTADTLQAYLDKLNYLKEISSKPLADNIKNISGLLFVCFQSNIILQFSKIQAEWADVRDFPREGGGKYTYLEPIVGHPRTQGHQGDPDCQEWPTKKGDGEDVVSYGFFGCVKNRGGEFFFAPSISFLKGI